MTTPFPHFVQQNSDIPDLSIPELWKRVCDEEELMNQGDLGVFYIGNTVLIGKQSQCLTDVTNKRSPSLKGI